MRSPSASAPSTYGPLATIYATLAHLYSGGARTALTDTELAITAQYENRDNHHVTDMVTMR